MASVNADIFRAMPAREEGPMIFGHLPEILGLLLVGLLIFGPRKMIEMGSSLGRAVRQFREATKDLSWQELTGMGSATETPRQTAMSKLSQFSQAFGVATGASEAPPPASTTTTPAPSTIVDAAAGPVPPVDAAPQAERTQETEHAAGS
jgi:TatA/E family protein of Tat protein translocase